MKLFPFFGLTHFITERFVVPKKAHSIVNLFHIVYVFTWNPDFIVSRSYFFSDFLLILKNKAHFPDLWKVLLIHHALSYYILENYKDDENIGEGLKWIELSNLSLAMSELFPSSGTHIAKTFLYPWCRCIMLPVVFGRTVATHGAKALVLGAPIIIGSAWWSSKILAKVC